MPKLPSRLDRAIPQGRRGITRVNTTVGGEAAMDAGNIRDRGAQNLAAGVGSLGNSMQRAQDAVDEGNYLDARGKFLQAKVTQDSAYDKDPDWGTYEKRYGETLTQARGELAAGIRNPKLRQRFEIETSNDLAQGSAQIRAKAFDRESKDGLDTLELTLADNTQAALKARDEPTRTTLLNASSARIDAAVKAGYISAPASKLLKRKMAGEYAKQSIELLPPTERLMALIPGAGAPKAGITRTSLLPPDIDTAIKGAPKNDQATLARIAELESGGNAGAVNPQSGASGLFQFMPDTAAQYGLADPKDPKAATEAAAKLLDDNRTSLRGALNREPSPAELYLAHQQGAGGAAALLSNPDQPAIVALTAVYGDAGKAKAAIIQNGGTQNMTAGQFTTLWTNKFNGGDGAPVGAALSGEIPSGGWDFSQPTGTNADVIDPMVRAEMIAAATKQMKEESTAARQAVQVEVALGNADANQSAYLTGKADPVYEAKVMAAYPDERGIGMVQEYRRNAQTGEFNNLVKSQPIATDIATLAGMEAAAREPGPGSAERAAAYTNALGVIKAKHDALAKDPASYVIENDPAAADAFDQIQALDPQDPESTMRARLAAETILASQRTMGLTDDQARILPVTNAAAIADMIEPKTGQSGEEAVANIRAQSEQWGPYWPKVWSEIGGNVGDAGRMVAIMDPAQNIAAARLVEANQQKETLEKQTAGQVGTDIKAGVDTAFEEFMETFAHSNAAAEGLRYKGQGELLARRYVAVDGMQPDAAAERAYQETIGSVYDTTAGVRVPKRYDVEDVVAGADQAVRTLSAIDTVMDDLGAGDAAQAQYLASIKENHRWVNSPDGTGLSLLDLYDRPVLVYGAPYTVSFDDLAKAQALPATRFSGYGRQ